MKKQVIDVRISGKTAYLTLDDETFETLDKLLRFHPPGYKYTPEYRLWVACQNDPDVEEGAGWDGYRHFLTPTGRLPVQLFRSRRNKLEQEANIKFNVTDEDVKPIFFKALGKVSNRDYQNDCVLEMCRATEQGGGLILNATGTGKTYIGALYFSFLDGNAVFVVDEIGLMRQAQKELASGLGEEVGIIGDSIFEPKRITVATVQSLHKHSDKAHFRRWRRDVDVVFVDELHKALNRRHFAVVRSIPAGAVFGLTATLRLTQRHVRMQANALCGRVVFSYPLVQGVKEGFLTKGRVIQVEHQQYSEKQKSLIGYNLDYEDLIVESESRNRLIYQLVKKCLKKDRYVAVLVERVKHLKILSEMFHKIPHQVVFGKVKGVDRLDAVKDFEHDEFRLILANVVFTKGIDIKRLDAIVDGAAKRSPDDALQKFGRGVRKHKDKTLLLYYDIRDTGNRFEEAADERKKAFEKVGIEVRVRKDDNYKPEPKQQSLFLTAIQETQASLRKKTA